MELIKTKLILTSVIIALHHVVPDSSNGVYLIRLKNDKVNEVIRVTLRRLDPWLKNGCLKNLFFEAAILLL